MLPISQLLILVRTLVDPVTVLHRQFVPPAFQQLLKSYFIIILVLQLVLHQPLMMVGILATLAIHLARNVMEDLIVLVQLAMMATL